MRIMKDGRDRTWQAECNKCHTIYEYGEADYFELIEEKPSGIVKVKKHLFKTDEEYREICKYRWNKCLKCPICENIKKGMDAERLFSPETVRWDRIK